MPTSSKFKDLVKSVAKRVIEYNRATRGKLPSWSTILRNHKKYKALCQKKWKFCSMAYVDAILRHVFKFFEDDDDRADQFTPLSMLLFVNKEIKKDSDSLGIKLPKTNFDIINHILDLFQGLRIGKYKTITKTTNGKKSKKYIFTMNHSIVALHFEEQREKVSKIIRAKFTGICEPKSVDDLHGIFDSMLLRFVQPEIRYRFLEKRNTTTVSPRYIMVTDVVSSGHSFLTKYGYREHAKFRNLSKSERKDFVTYHAYTLATYKTSTINLGVPGHLLVVQLDITNTNDPKIYWIDPNNRPIDFYQNRNNGKLKKNLDRFKELCVSAIVRTLPPDSTVLNEIMNTASLPVTFVRIPNLNYSKSLDKRGYALGYDHNYKCFPKEFGNWGGICFLISHFINFRSMRQTFQDIDSKTGNYIVKKYTFPQIAKMYNVPAGAKILYNHLEIFTGAVLETAEKLGDATILETDEKSRRRSLQSYGKTKINFLPKSKITNFLRVKKIKDDEFAAIMSKLSLRSDFQNVTNRRRKKKNFQNVTNRRRKKKGK